MAIKLNIAEEFSPVPIGRYRDDSEKSGEAFREDLLRPKIEEAIKEGETLVIDFDGMEGLNSSFLDEAFGGLIREPGDMPLSVKQVRQVLQFLPEKSYYDPYIADVKQYIDDAETKK